MILGFLDWHTIVTIIHVFGAILGAGGAFASDGMFFTSVKDGRIDETELRFLQLGSRLVWTGVLVLVISGAILFSYSPDSYLSSDKFLAKMTIVAIVVANGLIFHFIHLPVIRRTLGIRFGEAPSFGKIAPFLMASGAVSMVSWISAVALGLLRSVPYNYATIMGIYVAALLIGIASAMIMKNRILHLRGR